MEPVHESATALTDEERSTLREALRMPRGRYPAERAAQLSGVPLRTVYDWAKKDVVAPDYDDSPMAWSYRDLVYLRLTAWLRTRHIPLPHTVEVVRRWRRDFEADPGPEVTTVSSDGVGLGSGSGFAVDELTGQQVFATMIDTVAVFDFLAPLDAKELGKGRLWGPNLVRPSAATAMSPWIMRGEPCIRGSRLATGPLYVLATHRQLSTDQIVALYPGLTTTEVKDAIRLEARLRAA